MITDIASYRRFFDTSAVVDDRGDRKAHPRSTPGIDSALAGSVTRMVEAIGMGGQEPSWIA
jgi:hypothetical protein